MPDLDYFVDLHCHPTLKPFEKSLLHRYQHSDDFRDRHSIWYYRPPNMFCRALNYLSSLTKFTQSSFSQMHKARAKVVCAALYPFEQPFLNNRLGSGWLSYLLTSLPTGMHAQKAAFIRAWRNYDYFYELEAERKYLEQLQGKIVLTPSGEQATYRLIRYFEDLQANLADAAHNSIAVIPTIEGGHALGLGLKRDDYIHEDLVRHQILKHVAAIKHWAYPPLFITLAHHFYNELCGHAASFPGLSRRILDQRQGLNEGFTPLGIEVVHHLLDNSSGSPILIDVKHMSQKARQEYYALLDESYADRQIPIIASHGAVSGFPSQPQRFLGGDINFGDQELIRIARSGGIMGLQLDERRIGSRKAIRKARGFTRRARIMHSWAGLVWHQIQHMAEVLDQAELFAWGSLCLGTDFDGIINPIGRYWTFEELRELEGHLLQYAMRYMEPAGGKNPLVQAQNQISPKEIIRRFMQQNAMQFFERVLPRREVPKETLEAVNSVNGSKCPPA